MASDEDLQSNGFLHVGFSQSAAAAQRAWRVPRRHRRANEPIASRPEVRPKCCGVRDHAHLVEIYERLRDIGIKPFTQLNHRFTTSLYYHDPDGNEVEFSVDNFPTKQECSDFVASEAMAEIGMPPFGYDFDPEEMARLHHAGASISELARFGLP